MERISECPPDTCKAAQIIDAYHQGYAANCAGVPAEWPGQPTGLRLDAWLLGWWAAEEAAMEDVYLRAGEVGR